MHHRRVIDANIVFFKFGLCKFYPTPRPFHSAGNFRLPFSFNLPAKSFVNRAHLKGLSRMRLSEWGQSISESGRSWSVVGTEEMAQLSSGQTEGCSNFTATYLLSLLAVNSVRGMFLCPTGGSRLICWENSSHSHSQFSHGPCGDRWNDHSWHGVSHPCTPTLVFQCLLILGGNNIFGALTHWKQYYCFEFSSLCVYFRRKIVQKNSRNERISWARWTLYIVTISVLHEWPPTLSGLWVDVVFIPYAEKLFVFTPIILCTPNIRWSQQG